MTDGAGRRRIEARGPLLAAMVALTAPCAARADDGYGAHVAGVDATADVLLIGSVVSRGPGESRAQLAVFAASLYLLGGPVVHLAHAEPARAAQSLGVRVGVPLLGAMLGASLDSRGRDRGESRDGFLGMSLGFIAGVLVAQLLDARYLAGGSDEPATRMISIGRSF